MLETQQNDTHLGAVLRRVDSYFEKLDLPKLEADVEAPKVIAISDLEDCTNKDLENYLLLFGGFRSYLDTKLKILTNQNDKCYAIINKNDVKISKQKYKSNIIEFYISESGEMIVNDKIKIMDIQNSKLLGGHNYQNILAASIVADLCKISDKLILESINFFKPLYHRLEKLTPIKNIIYYNDSKATNLSATVAAIESIDKNIILILGGIDKNNSDFSILKNYKSKIKHIILYGQSRHHIEKQINNFFNLISYSDFKKAIKKAIKISVLNDNILFSPACASFDQFKNYKERGNYFKEIISNYYDQN